MATNRVILELSGMPEVLAGMRAEFARLIREVALDETPEVAQRLNEIAAQFESGASEEV